MIDSLKSSTVPKPKAKNVRTVNFYFERNPCIQNGHKKNPNNFSKSRSFLPLSEPSVKQVQVMSLGNIVHAPGCAMAAREYRLPQSAVSQPTGKDDRREHFDRVDHMSLLVVCPGHNSSHGPLAGLRLVYMMRPLRSLDRGCAHQNIAPQNEAWMTNM